MSFVSHINKADFNRILKMYADIEIKLKRRSSINRIINDISYHQPFFLFILDRYQRESDKETFKPLLKLYFLVWTFYKRKVHIQNRPVTSERYMQAEYEIAGIEEDEKFYDNLESPGSRAMISILLTKFRVDPDFETLLTKSDGSVFVSICSFIRCFDEITTKRWP